MAKGHATQYLKWVRDKLKKLGRGSNAVSAEPAGNATKRKSTKKVGTKRITKKFILVMMKMMLIFQVVMLNFQDRVLLNFQKRKR